MDEVQTPKHAKRRIRIREQSLTKKNLLGHIVRPGQYREKKKKLVGLAQKTNSNL
jgi:hypothetical protein